MKPACVQMAIYHGVSADFAPPTSHNLNSATAAAAAAAAAAADIEGSYDLEEEGQGEFDSFVEPAGLILSSFIRKYLILHPGREG
jgi:hypothetical protein